MTRKFVAHVGHHSRQPVVLIPTFTILHGDTFVRELTLLQEYQVLRLLPHLVLLGPSALRTPLGLAHESRDGCELAPDAVGALLLDFHLKQFLHLLTLICHQSQEDQKALKRILLALVLDFWLLVHDAAHQTHQAGCLCFIVGPTFDATKYFTHKAN